MEPYDRNTHGYYDTMYLATLSFFHLSVVGARRGDRVGNRNQGPRFSCHPHLQKIPQKLLPKLATLSARERSHGRHNNVERVVSLLRLMIPNWLLLSLFPLLSAIISCFSSPYNLPALQHHP